MHESPIFSDANLPIFEQGINAYFDANHIACVHILVPQIEQVFRNLLKALAQDGAVIYKPKKGGSLQLKNLDDILRDPQVQEIIHEGGARFFQVLFTDSKGLNIRNQVTH